jgi:CheY-like chemotaxis protein
MSHELRTPLNGILGFSETLLEGIRGPLDERQRQAVEVINSSGQHLLGLINDILDLSKIESGKFELRGDNISVNDVCRSSLSFVNQIAIKKHVNIDYERSPDAVMIFADSKRLKQVLVNLLNNAVKFTPENGTVKLEVSMNVAGNFMEFSVADTGIGISPENQQKLFKPFVQVDGSLSRQYEGTGLGLSLVKKLVELHGGSVGVESEVGAGSRFYFTIPVMQHDTVLLDAEAAEGPLPLSPHVHRKLSILLAEDNPVNSMVTSDYFITRGYTVINAIDGLDAVEKVNTFSPSLIIMDIQMPGLDGIEAIRRIRTMPKAATVPIIALTARAMPGDRERCLEAGANEYVTKPAKLRELAKMVDDMLVS